MSVPVPPNAERSLPSMTPVAPPPPEPSRRRFGRWLTSLVLSIVIAMTFIALNIKRTPRFEQDIAVAEQFADALRFGSGIMPGGDGKTTGYEAAFELLTDKKKDDIGPLGFIGTFDDLSAKHGFLQATKRIVREAGRSASRRLYFHLIYSGETGDREIVEMTVTMEPAGRVYRVADFTCRTGDEDKK